APARPRRVPLSTASFLSSCVEPLKPLRSYPTPPRCGVAAPSFLLPSVKSGPRNRRTEVSSRPGILSSMLVLLRYMRPRAQRDETHPCHRRRRLTVTPLALTPEEPSIGLTARQFAVGN